MNCPRGNRNACLCQHIWTGGYCHNESTPNQSKIVYCVFQQEIASFVNSFLEWKGYSYDEEQQIRNDFMSRGFSTDQMYLNYKEGLSLKVKGLLDKKCD